MHLSMSHPAVHASANTSVYTSFYLSTDLFSPLIRPFFFLSSRPSFFFLTPHREVLHRIHGRNREYWFAALLQQCSIRRPFSVASTQFSSPSSPFPVHFIWSIPWCHVRACLPVRLSVWLLVFIPVCLLDSLSAGLAIWLRLIFPLTHSRNNLFPPTIQYDSLRPTRRYLLVIHYGSLRIVLASVHNQITEDSS